MSYQRRSRFPWSSTRAAFTYIDLLIIFAVLAILAGILFPVLWRVRQLASQSQCASNLQQFSAAFTVYAQDWNSFWPCPGGKVGDWTYWAQSGNGGLQSYVRQRGNKSVWCCPLMPEWRSKYPVRSYSMNSYLRQPCDVEYIRGSPASCTNIIKGIDSNRIPQPNRTILLFEGVPLTVGWENNEDYVYIYRCCNWTGVRGYYDKLAYTIDPGRPWHGRRNNYLYSDGHLVSRPPGKYYPPGLSTYKEMYEWYVDKAHYEVVFQKQWARLVPKE